MIPSTSLPHHQHTDSRRFVNSEANSYNEVPFILHRSALIKWTSYTSSDGRHSVFEDMTLYVVMKRWNISSHLVCHDDMFLRTYWPPTDEWMYVFTNIQARKGLNIYIRLILVTIFMYWFIICDPLEAGVCYENITMAHYWESVTRKHVARFSDTKRASRNVFSVLHNKPSTTVYCLHPSCSLVQTFENMNL